MGFEESALARLRRYRQEADRSLELVREAEGAARKFSERLFAGLERVAVLGRQAGFEVEADHMGDLLTLRVVAGTGAGAEAAFGLLRGAAAEADEDLMHEELSRYSLDPSGYSGRILGWSAAAGEGACQTFAVYRDGTWKTKGRFVTLARGRLDDPDEVLDGFCLRILGRLVDLAALTGGAGRRWPAAAPFSLEDFAAGRKFPTEQRMPR